PRDGNSRPGRRAGIATTRPVGKASSFPSQGGAGRARLREWVVPSWFDGSGSGNSWGRYMEVFLMIILLRVVESIELLAVTEGLILSCILSRSRHRGGRALLEVSSRPLLQRDAKQPIRILLNYDAVGHSPDRDCQNVGDLVKIVGTTAHRRTFQGRIKNDVFESLTQSVGHVNVAPRHLTAEAETLLSATLIHEVSKVLQISPSITPVPEFEIMVLLSTVLMLFCQAFSEKFTGLELEDGGGRGTSGTFNFISVM
ncbi:hypothetical protein BHE74_00011182, partial [Ensete ventricosum]